MNFSEVKSLTIPEGEAAVISCNGKMLWQKNLFDGEVIRGHVDATNGTVYTTSAYQKTAMSKNEIPVFGGALVTVSNDMNYYTYIMEYDAAQKFIRTQKTTASAITVRLHPNTQYIRIRSDYTLTQNDLSVKYTVALYVPEKKLPEEYQAVAYLKSNSAAYIDSGVSGDTENLAIGISFSIDKSVTYGAIYGNYVSDSHDGVRLIVGDRANSFISNMNTICTTRGNAVVGTNVASDSFLSYVFDLERDAASYKLNGTITTNLNAAKGTANSGNIALFNRSLTNPNTTRDLGLAVSDCWMMVNGVYVRDYIPCYRKSDGKPGLYDFVTETLFTSCGAGEFTILE